MSEIKRQCRQTIQAHMLKTTGVENKMNDLPNKRPIFKNKRRSAGAKSVTIRVQMTKTEIYNLAIYTFKKM